jgi:acetyltransferase-like isoleucine patch superfamily enzyme
MIINESKILDCKISSDVIIVKPVNLYGCEIMSGSFVGPFVEIQKNVIIGKKCRVQSHSFICELTTIGSNCFIGHGVMFVNDKFTNGGPAKGNKELWKEIFIGNNVSLGSNCTILPCRIADNVVVGAGSVVTKDLTIPGVYYGNPARLMKKFV